VHSIGEFASWKGAKPLRDRFLGDLLRVIRDYVDNSFAMALYIRDYIAVNREYCLREWAHPYALAGAHCIGMTKAWAIKRGYDISAIDHVFEDGDEGKGDLFQISSRHLSVDPIFKPKDWSVVFQAADLIAYEHYKAHLKILEVGERMAGVEDFRIPFQSLVSIPGSMGWGVVKRENLIGDCQKYGVPLRTL
jgi:hypothetical protein